MLAFASINFATSQNVTGKVLGTDGTPITGVNVIEKGTSNGAISDLMVTIKSVQLQMQHLCSVM